MKALLEERYGWRRFVREGVALWFKGYLLNKSMESLHSEAIQFSRSNPKITELAEWVKELNGNFSLVLDTPEWLFAAVDKVCSIPLFYTNVRSKNTINISDEEPSIKISNFPTLLSDESSFTQKDLDLGAVLEIAMSGYSIGCKCLYKGLFQLTAGECLLQTKNGMVKTHFYTYFPCKIQYRSEKQLKEELSEAMLQSLDTMVSSLDGQQIVIPLSAGSDSRLIASGLKHLGVKNVHCFAYGLTGSFESITSQAVANKLSYSWSQVPLTSKIQRKYFSSDEFKEYQHSCNTFSSVPHIQEVNAIRLLKNTGIIDDNAVIVNGNTGDFISGGHIPSIFKNYTEKKSSETLIEKAWSDYLDKHYMLWKILRNIDNDTYINKTISDNLSKRISINELTDEQLHGLFECAEYLGRQSKYIVGMQRAYEFNGFDWRMPLWGDHVLNFWESVPREYKLNQALYKNTLYENNWGKVWQDIPVNRKTIHPAWLRPLRFLSKSLLFPFGKNAWHGFERNVFRYFLDITRSSVIVPYHQVLLDRRGQRHGVSWMAEKYLQLHGITSIKQTPVSDWIGT